MDHATIRNVIVPASVLMGRALARKYPNPPHVFIRQIIKPPFGSEDAIRARAAWERGDDIIELPSLAHVCRFPDELLAEISRGFDSILISRAVELFPNLETVAIVAPFSRAGYLSARWLDIMLKFRMRHVRIRPFLVRGRPMDCALPERSSAYQLSSATAGLVTIAEQLGLDSTAVYVIQMTPLAVAALSMAHLCGLPIRTATGRGCLLPLPLDIDIDLWRRHFLWIDAAARCLEFAAQKERGALGWFDDIPRGDPELRLLVRRTPGGRLALTSTGRRLHERATELYRDRVTGVYSRAFFDDVLVPLLRGLPVGSVGCFLVDVDNFKSVNDTFGHAVGDRLLRSIAAKLDAVCASRPFGTAWLVRWGGDEFLGIVLDTPDAAASMAQQFLVSESWQGRDVSVSVGGCYGRVAALDRARLLDLIQRSDRALLQAKALGGGKVSFGEVNL